MSTHNTTLNNAITTLTQIISQIIIQVNTNLKPAHRASLHDSSPLLPCPLLNSFFLDLLHAAERAIVPTTIRAALGFHLFNAGPSCAIVLAAALVCCQVGKETTS